MIIYIAQHSSHKLEVGSLVQFSDPVQYGVIKRIVDTSKKLAEVEMVSCVGALASDLVTCRNVHPVTE